MKLSHNKKRNTALIYEILIKELTKSILHKENAKKGTVISILKEYFGKEKILRKEKEIYDSFSEIEDLPQKTIEKLIIEAKKQFSSISKKEVFNQQTNLINKMNKTLTKNIWKTFVPSFKRLATINQILQENLNPKKQILLEKKFLDSFTTKTEEDNGKFPKINNLAMKNFVEKFNEQYSANLNESQKEFLNKYITSYMDNGLEFKALLYEEITRLSTTLKENISSQNHATKEKMQKLLERISNYNQRKLDKSLVLEIFQIQSLVSEINK
jgi:hypothetical protein